MLEVIKIVANYGFPAILCIYLLGNFAKRLDRLDKTISNDLIHAIERNTEETKKDAEASNRVEKAIEKLSDKFMEYMRQ